MKSYNVHEAKTHLSRILARVQQGESVIIGRAGTPVAVLSPYVAGEVTRKPGTMKGRIQIGEDFDAEDDTVIRMFERAAEDAADEEE